MATKTIVSDQSKTPVGSKKTELYTRTRITYSLDQNGKVDPNSIKQEILYQQVPGDPPVVAATRNGATGDFTFNKNSFTGETYFGADAQKSLKEGALKATTNQQITTASKKEGLTPEQTKVLSDATKNNASDIEKEAAARATSEIKKELSEVRERRSYDPLIIYPEKLRLEYQDCIKFSMLKYVQSGLSPGTTAESLGTFARSVIVKNGVPTVGERKPITTMVLPIPGGINDSNTVDWQGDSLDEISKAFANIAQQTITKGGPGADKSIGQTADATEKNIEGLKATFASKFTEAATGTSRIMQRQYGAAPNPNLELLFNGPQLRTFSFNFKLSPRTETEAIIVKKMIRYFKQGMTPKRSSGYLLLQSPHTFAISYLTANKEHPYLNKFKECALTQCNVNYTPEGNYMSFDGAERSMTSYELTLQFQELVPLFDDDYSALDENKDKVIGF